jgi:hypothetical protein
VLQAAADVATDPFLQYGVVGVVATLFIGVSIKLFNMNQVATRSAMERIEAQHAAEIVRIEASYKSAFERADAAFISERSRADRMESELREMNRLINDKLAGELVRASDTVREALEQRQSERRRQP